MNDVTMRVELLIRLLEIQSMSGYELLMAEFLERHCQEEGYHVTVDGYLNVFVTKGKADYYPTVAAHIDTVHPFRRVNICYSATSDKLIGFVEGTEERTGIGGDCKTGIFVCLELLRTMPILKVAFFAQEETGCGGARSADPDFFKNVGYMIEFDCPSRNMMSYTSSGKRLFANDGAFINAAIPVLREYNVKWQNHPYTDVHVIRPRYGMSCLNLASGYYNWHMATEFVYVPDVDNAIQMGVKLVNALGCVNYPYQESDAMPQEPVTNLAVTAIV